MLLARTEALDEVEAVAEQCFTAALALERAEHAKQARCLLCTRGSCCNARAWLCRASMPQTVSEPASHALHVAAWCCSYDLGWTQACLSKTGLALLIKQYPLPR